MKIGVMNIFYGLTTFFIDKKQIGDLSIKKPYKLVRLFDWLTLKNSHYS